MRILLALLATSWLATAVAAPPSSFDADFRRDPSHQSFVVQGEDDDRFTWIRGRGLAVALDSNEPGSRLVAPLGMTLDGSRTFRLETEFTIVSIDASPDDFFQFAFGLCSLDTTGLNRTGTSLPGPPFFVDDSDVFDSVELAYYPNVTFFGGPFLQPTVFGAERGSAFANFAANFGPSADLGDATGSEIRELPQGTPLRVVLEHDACAQVLTTRVFDLSSGAPEELATGLLALDLSALNATGTFRVDAFAVHAYQDLADFDPSTPSLRMDVEFHRVVVEGSEPLAARLLPRAVNAEARAPARIALSGAVAGAAVTLVESGGMPVSVPLESRATGGGVIVELPRALAVPPLAVDAGGCRVAVDGPRSVVPR